MITSKGATRTGDARKGRTGGLPASVVAGHLVTGRAVPQQGEVLASVHVDYDEDGLTPIALQLGYMSQNMILKPGCVKKRATSRKMRLVRCEPEYLDNIEAVADYHKNRDYRWTHVSSVVVKL